MSVIFSSLTRSTRDSVTKNNFAFKLLFWEGAFSMVHDTWTGSAYLSGLAGELGASVFWVSVLCSAAWIGAVGQLLGVWVYERVPSYKQYTVRMAVAARVLWLLPLGSAAFWWYRSRIAGIPFPVETWCAITAMVACGAALLGASSASAWSSWMRSLVPDAKRARFFGERQRFVTVALVVANLAASTCVSWRPGGVYAGFAILGALSLAFAAVSAWLLNRVEDSGQPSGQGPKTAGDFVEWIRGPLRDPGFRGVVIYGAAFNGVMQLASPYFPYYFTKELGFSMSQIAFWTVLTNIGCVVAAAKWGRYLDREGRHPRKTMRSMGSLVALSPLFYLVSSPEWVRFIAPFDYFTNGIVWCGYWLGLTTLLYRAIPANSGVALCFSIYTAAAGLCGVAGSLLGGKLAVWLAPWGGFKALWVVSSLARFAVLWGLFRLVAPHRLARGSGDAKAAGGTLAESSSQLVSEPA
jgi:hypothetical protein